jgi:hypothetical protein
MRSRLLRGLAQAYIGQGIQPLIQSPLLLGTRQQLGISPWIGLLYTSSSHSNSSRHHGGSHKAWWSATAGALSAGLALTAACAPAEADSSATQMQQTQSAARAAQRASNHNHSPYSNTNTGERDSGYLESDSPWSNVLEIISDATACVPDVIQDLFQHAEARCAASTDSYSSTAHP